MPSSPKASFTFSLSVMLAYCWVSSFQPSVLFQSKVYVTCSPLAEKLHVPPSLMPSAEESMANL